MEKGIVDQSADEPLLSIKPVYIFWRAFQLS
jgi:hypothetical protein